MPPSSSIGLLNPPMRRLRPPASIRARMGVLCPVMAVDRGWTRMRMGHKDMFIYIWTPDDRQNRLLAGCFGQPRRHWRGDAPARLRAADRGGTGGERIGGHSRAVATPRLASSPAPAR